MKPTQRLHELGQSLWLDNITREMRIDGTLRHYIGDFRITGLTSNPTIFERAIRTGHLYDDSIRRRMATHEDLLIDLALEDLAHAADLFGPVDEATAGADGWVSMEVSPRLADDTAGAYVKRRDSMRKRDEALVAPDTIKTIPDKTLRAFADLGQVKGVLPVDGGDAEDVIDQFRRAGVEDAALAGQLQSDGYERSNSHGAICSMASLQSAKTRFRNEGVVLDQSAPTRSVQNPR